MTRAILPGGRYRVCVVTRRDGRRWPYQLKVTDRVTGQVTWEALRGLAIRQRARAYERAADRERQLNGLAPAPAAPALWAEARAAGLADLAAKRRPATVAAYRKALSWLERYGAAEFPRGLTYVEDVTGPRANRFVAWRRAPEPGVSAPETTTVNRDLRHLQGFWSHLLRLGLATENPWRAVPRLQELRRLKVRWNPDQYHRAQAAAAEKGAKFGAAFRLVADTALRAAELSHVTWQHVDIRARVLLLTREACGWAPKDHEEGLLRFGRATALALRDWRQACLARLMVGEGLSRGRAEAVLAGQRVFGLGRSPLADPWERRFNFVLGEVCVEAEVPPLTSHGLRRTVARLARTAGADREDVRQLLRHSSYTTTEGYVGDEQADGAARAFAALDRIGARQVPQPKKPACGRGGRRQRKPANDEDL